MVRWGRRSWQKDSTHPASFDIKMKMRPVLEQRERERERNAIFTSTAMVFPLSSPTQDALLIAVIREIAHGLHIEFGLGKHLFCIHGSVLSYCFLTGHPLDCLDVWAQHPQGKYPKETSSCYCNS